MPAKRTVEERFWPKVIKSEGCWGWSANKTPTGYGQMRISEHMGYAHRVSYEIHNGPIPDGMEIDHICLNRGCVNPDHLRAVTRKQNNENKSGPLSNSKSGVRGVIWRADMTKWQASYRHHGKQYYVGNFVRLEDAEAAVIEARRNVFTHSEMDKAA